MFLSEGYNHREVHAVVPPLRRWIFLNASKQGSRTLAARRAKGKSMLKQHKHGMAFRASTWCPLNERIVPHFCCIYLSNDVIICISITQIIYAYTTFPFYRANIRRTALSFRSPDNAVSHLQEPLQVKEDLQESNDFSVKSFHIAAITLHDDY